MPRGKGRGKNKRRNTGDDSFEMPTTVEGIMELLQNVQNMHPAQLMKLQASLDDPSQVPPFPSNKVNRCLKRVSAITNYEDLKLDDVSQLQSWCKEDFYMESIFDAGVVPVLAHILNLCKSYASGRVTKKITSKLTSTQNRKLELTLYSIADGLLNENNKQKTDLSEVVPLLISFIHQEGDIGKGFPLTVTAMNYAIKALGETYRALAIQKEEGLANLIADDTQLLEIVRVYIRNDQISTPIGMKVSSLLCSLRFVQMLAMTSPKCLHTMAALGYRETLQAITANDTQTSVIIENTLGLFQGEFKFDVPVEAGAYHTKKQLKRLCAYCGIEENPTEPHKKCSRCKRRHYCSRQCQVDHWKAAHSQECASLATK